MPEFALDCVRRDKKISSLRIIADWLDICEHSDLERAGSIVIAHFGDAVLRLAVLFARQCSLTITHAQTSLSAQAQEAAVLGRGDWLECGMAD